MMFFPTKLKNVTPLFGTPEKKVESPVEPSMPCVEQLRIPTAKAPTYNVAVSKEGGRGDTEHCKNGDTL